MGYVVPPKAIRAAASVTQLVERFICPPKSRLLINNRGNSAALLRKKSVYREVDRTSWPVIARKPPSVALHPSPAFRPQTKIQVLEVGALRELPRRLSRHHGILARVTLRSTRIPPELFTGIWDVGAYKSRLVTW